MVERATAATDPERRRHFAGRLPWEAEEPTDGGAGRRSGPWQDAAAVGEFAGSAPVAMPERSRPRSQRPRAEPKLAQPEPGRREPLRRGPEPVRAGPTEPEPVPPDLGRRSAEVAHDFNNLLAVIMACAGEIAAVAEGAQLERAEEIRAAARRGTELSRRLLGSSRVAAGAGPGCGARPLAVATALAGSRRLIERALGPGIRLGVEIAAALPHVAIGVTELERVLLNLAANAREAMPAGGVVTIAAGLVAIAPGDLALGTGWHVRIDFADDGPGMSAEVARRAAEPYFSTKEGAAGSNGLGLAGARSIARSAGGELRIDARPGAGTTVSILLPAVDAAGGALSLPARAGG